MALKLTTASLHSVKASGSRGVALGATFGACAVATYGLEAWGVSIGDSGDDRAGSVVAGPLAGLAELDLTSSTILEICI